VNNHIGNIEFVGNIAITPTANAWNFLIVIIENTEFYKYFNRYFVVLKQCVNHIVQSEIETKNKEKYASLLMVNMFTLKPWTNTKNFNASVWIILSLVILCQCY
jgi:hypothetical protein